MRFFSSLICLILPCLAAAEVYAPKAVTATPAMIAEWEKKCTEGKTASACYNLGVHFAQSMDSEGKARIYYDKACQAGDGLGCFNLGGILIEDRDTRVEGAAGFDSACKISADKKQLEKMRRLLHPACHIADIVKKNKGDSYEDLAEKLQLAK